MPIATDRPTANDVFQATSAVATHGLQIVQLYGIAADGECECGEPAKCSGTGKHPKGFNWQHRATTDEHVIASWFENEDETVPNVGVLLGQASGVIDIEADTEEAMAALKRWGIDRIATPTFRSGRSPHFFFKWETGLPEKAVVKLDGIECRLGNSGAAQTVIPPSWHASGVAREWLPGRSLEECDLQPLPEAFRDAVIRAGGGKGKGITKAAREATVAGKVFKEGEGRHEQLYAEAVNFARDLPHSSEEEVERIHQIVLGLNLKQCNPPYPEDEVRRCTNDAICYVRDKEAERMNAQRTPWERMGLVKHPVNTSEYERGGWLLTVRHSDPKEYVIDGVISPTSGAVAVILTADDFLSAAKTARKILSTAGDVDPTNPNSAEWSRLWNGYSKEQEGGGRRTVKGLKCKLMDDCLHYVPPAEYQRYSLLASWMLDYLRRFKKPTSEDVTEPSPTGTPKWIFAGGQPALAFRYEDAWRRAVEQAGGAVTTAEWRDVSRRIRNITGEKEFSDMSRRRKGDSPGCRFTLWDDRHIAALEKLAGV